MADLPAPPTFKAALIRLGVALVIIGVLIVATINYSTYTPPAANASSKNSQTSNAKSKKPSPKKSTNKSASKSNASQQSAAQNVSASDAIERAALLAPKPTSPVLADAQILSGSRFTQTPQDVYAVPSIISIGLPRTKQSYAIWGALGTDDKGLIWTAISTDGRGESSAQLVSFDPNTGSVSRGIVLDELKNLGLYQPKMGQAKIHSRIIQGADGYLYFASLDEQGEAENGSSNPTWGSWMWRTRAPDYQWEPLFHAPQGLIAVAGFGTDIYALGYHNHVLYHFDTLTGKHMHIQVGSVQGHISRNILADNLGHVFVPRLTAGQVAGQLASDPPTVELVQFDRNLKEIHATKIDHYLKANPADSHGIISSVTMDDGSIIFATHHGFLYRIEGATRHGRPSTVEPVGYFHPDGARYTSTMHTYDGRRYLVGVTKTKKPAKGQPAFEWIVYDRYLKTSKAMGLDIKPPARQSVQNLLLYGSMTRDANGNFYIVGTHLNARLPLLYKLSPKWD